MADLLMPKLGLTMTEGLLAQWRIAPGQHFLAGEVLFVVETEKVANEIEAEHDGTLASILVGEGDTVAVGTRVAILAPVGYGHEGSGPSGMPLDGSPTARKLIVENALDPDTISGTGRGGRITKGDVLRVIATPYARKLAAARSIDLRSVEGTGPNGRIKAADLPDAETDAGPGAESSSTAADSAAPAFEIVPDAVRLATARRVSAAKRDIPHFTLSDQIEVDALLAMRAQLNREPGRVRVSVTHLIIKALGLVLTAMPEVNRIWQDDRILAFRSADVALVTDTPQGLRIPVVRDAGRRSLDEIAVRAIALAVRARTNSLTASDVGGGSIAVSNVGMFGVTSITPIINPPQAMILGVGARRAVFRPDAQGAPALRAEIVLTLACDHRVIDGAPAARFLHTVVKTLEAPYRLLRAPAAIPTTE